MKDDVSMGTSEYVQLFSTTELASAAGVTPRTVRFYEAKGLLKPQLAGVTRVYTYRDRARLELILRGKRLGFSLDEIGEYLELYGQDPDQIEQIVLLARRTDTRLVELEQRKQDIEATIAELKDVKSQAIDKLKEHGVDLKNMPDCLNASAASKSKH